MKGERHDPDAVSPEIIEEIKRLSQAGKGQQFIANKLRLAWRTLDRIAENHGLTFKKNKRTDYQISIVIQRYGGFEHLQIALKQFRQDGMGWHRIAELVGLNRYACKVIVEEGRVPTFRNCKGRKPRAGS